MDKLERKPWFVVLVSVLSTLATVSLIESAGLPGPGAMSFSQGTLYCLCFGACYKLFSFGGWLLALCFMRPKDVPERGA